MEEQGRELETLFPKHLEKREKSCPTEAKGGTGDPTDYSSSYTQTLQTEPCFPTVTLPWSPRARRRGAWVAELWRVLGAEVAARSDGTPGSGCRPSNHVSCRWKLRSRQSPKGTRIRRPRSGQVSPQPVSTSLSSLWETRSPNSPLPGFWGLPSVVSSPSGWSKSSWIVNRS